MAAPAMTHVGPQDFPEYVVGLQQALQECRTAVQTLQEEVAAVRSTQQQPTAPTWQPGVGEATVGRAKVPKPDFFAGKSDRHLVDTWLFEIEQYFEACGVVGDDRAVTLAGFFLRAPAKVWYRANRASFTTWPVFKAALAKEYKVGNAEQVARERLYTIQQSGSLQAYLTRFRELELEVTDMGERDKRALFIRGLKPHIRELLNVHNPPSLQEAIEMAERIDAGVQFSRRQFDHGSSRTFQGSGHASSAPAPMELGNTEVRGHLRGKPVKSSSSESSVLRCWKCHQAGHLRRNCPAKGNGERH